MNVPKLRFKEFNDEWEKINLKNCLEFFSTNSLSRDQLSDTGVLKNIHYGDIHRKYGSIIKYSDIIAYVKDLDFNKYTLCKNGDLLIADASEDYDGIGKSTEIIEINSENIISGLHTIHIRDTKGKFVLGFKGYYFNSPIIHDQIRILANGFKVFGISKDTILSINAKIPTKNEQFKIVETLKFLDKKIELQSKKIENLKLYKKGLYVYLMKHASEYKIIKLGKLCNITTGKLDANAMKRNGKYRFYTCAEDYYYVDEYAFDTEALLISGNGANVGYIHYYKGKFNAYQRTYVLDNFIEDINYIKIFLDNNLKSRISSEVRAGNTPYITLSTLSEMNISIPIKEDDINLFNSINLIDNKIQLNNTRLNKLQELKKGLMQNMFV